MEWVMPQERSAAERPLLPPSHGNSHGGSNRYFPADVDMEFHVDAVKRAYRTSIA
jgi:hypothetical protein